MERGTEPARATPVPRRANRLAWATGLGIFLAAAGVWFFLDVDRDGASNMAEFQDGTQPFDSDSDGDGLADGWEEDHGLDPLAANGPSAVGGSDCGAVLAALCSGSGTEDGESGVSDAEAPSSHPVTTTVVYGGLTSLVAGIGARLTSHFILTRH